MKKVAAVLLCVVMMLSLAACRQNTNTQATENTDQNSAVFPTEGIQRITFYAYYGGGTGSDVPAEHLDEIISWLASFEIDKAVEDSTMLSPGTNTVYVEIEYIDGSVVKQGINTTTINGVTYYIRGGNPPACYAEILAKTSIN